MEQQKRDRRDLSYAYEEIKCIVIVVASVRLALPTERLPTTPFAYVCMNISHVRCPAAPMLIHYALYLLFRDIII